MSKDFELLNTFERSDSLCSPSPQSRLLSLLEERNRDKFVEVLKNNVRSGRVDVNFVYEDPVNCTLLDIACRSKNTSEFVKALIQYGAEVNTVNVVYKKAPLHFAAENSDADTLKVLVENKTVDINIKDGFSNTALHLAAKENKVNFIKILFEHPALDVNVSNRKGQTPLHLALTQNNADAVRLLLTRLDIDLDDQKNFRGQTCRELIKEKYPEMGLELKEMKFGTPMKNLFTFLYNRDLKSFIKLAKINSHNLSEHDGRHTYLQYACENGLSEVVDVLLKLGVDPNGHCPTNSDTPLLIAAHQGYYKILEKLLQDSQVSLDPVDGKSVLHTVFNGIYIPNDSGNVGGSEERDHYKCLMCLLNNPNTRNKLNVNFPDASGNTILHYAVRLNDDALITALLRAGAYIGARNSQGHCPLELISASALEDYLDSCISTNEQLSREDTYEIIYDYTILLPPKKARLDKRSIDVDEEEVYEIVSETEPLLLMSNLPELRKLLKHPVLTSFLNLKWYTISKYFYINCAFYLTFWLALTLYILSIYGSADSRNLASNSTKSLNDHEVPSNAALLWYMTFILSGMLLIREFFQFTVSPWSYLQSPENWLELTLITVTGAVLTYQSSLDVQPQLAAVAILASWMELILLIGRHPFLSTNIEMFKTVSYNFLKFLTWYSIVIVAFAISFFILFKDRTTDDDIFFRDPYMSIFKSVIMLTGEFDAGSIPFGTQLSTNHLLFVLFIFLVAIVLFNLLNGLAVSDTQAIRSDAEIVGNVSRARLISYIETMAIGDPFPCFRFFDKLTCLCCCVPVKQSSQNRQRHIKMFYKRITLFPFTLPDAKARVLPNQQNVIILDPKIKLQKETDDSCYTKYCSDWRMDPDVVKASKRILEKTNRSETNFAEIIKEYSKQMDTYKEKLDRLENSNEYNRKLLMEIMTMLKERL